MKYLYKYKNKNKEYGNNHQIKIHLKSKNHLVRLIKYIDIIMIKLMQIK